MRGWAGAKVKFKKPQHRAATPPPIRGGWGAHACGGAGPAPPPPAGADTRSVARHQTEPSGVALIVVEEKTGQNRISYVPGATLTISPDEVHGLPAEAQQDFLVAFVNALQPVFLVGAVLTALAFVLSWALKEVPLRGASGPPAELAAEEAVAGASGSEAIIDPEPTTPRR